MSSILIFAGTTEGRNLSECLCSSGIDHTICVATEYGEIVLKDSPYANVHMGRMDKEEIESFIVKGGYKAVVDATHPYAKQVTENIKAAIKDMDIPYIRLLRDGCLNKESSAEGNISFFDNNQACLQAITNTTGNILLTTGSKELGVFAANDAIKDRLFVRVLPSMESLKLCNDSGITGKHVIAMQGPFSLEMNLAVINQYDIKHLITKVSGTNGGYDQKIEAAKNAGIKVYAIGCDYEAEGISFNETIKKLEEVTGKTINIDNQIEITLAGIGMGDSSCLTEEVKSSINNADIILGADRMIADYNPRIDKKPYYSSDKIIPYLKEMISSYSELKNIVILFSGDSGFNSGAGSLYKKITAEIEAGNIAANIRILPGISSVAYLAAKTGISYEDASIVSIHGKEVPNLIKKIEASRKTFVLMSGKDDLVNLGKKLEEADLNYVRIYAGYQLSYDDEKILELGPKDCLKVKDDGLYTCLIINDEAESRPASHGLTDKAFIRDKVPMTKEEIREISICKLGLRTDSVLYDIGSGTGSIAIEAASLSDDIKVYAIEQKEEALSLIASNKEKFKLDNIEIVKGQAPDSLANLPCPSHAFIGGSSGRMKEILDYLRSINPSMRIVINAISLETVSEIKEIMKGYSICNQDLVQVQVSRANKVGNYNLMQAENPVWIFAFNFSDEQ